MQGNVIFLLFSRLRCFLTSDLEPRGCTMTSASYVTHFQEKAEVNNSQNLVVVIVLLKWEQQPYIVLPESLTASCVSEDIASP